MSENETLQLVTFELGSEMFAAPLIRIQEIIRYTDIIKVPQAPDFIEGIINLRGRVIAVIDLKKRFGMPGGEHESRSRIIVAEIAGVRVGLAVDAVARVLRVSSKQFERTPAIVSGVQQKFVAGVVKEKGGMIIVLDLDKIFTPEETEMLRSVE
jgi:purine-binding chemotaxis protein CheW